MFNTPLLIALETPFELSTVVTPNTSNSVFGSMLMPVAVVACILLLTVAVFFAVNRKYATPFLPISDPFNGPLKHPTHKGNS